MLKKIKAPIRNFLFILAAAAWIVAVRLLLAEDALEKRIRAKLTQVWGIG